MSISSIGQVSGGQAVQNSSVNQSEIKALEKQKQELQTELNEINQDKKTSQEEKQKKIQVIQAEIQRIEAQIQQAKGKGSQKQATAQEPDSAAVFNKQSQTQGSTGEGIDIQV